MIKDPLPLGEKVVSNLYLEKAFNRINLELSPLQKATYDFKDDRSK